jgi:hypothetical protein
MKTINHAELIEIIKKSQGALIVGIQALTDAKAKKTNNPFGQIFKQFRTVGFVGADYELAVLNEGFRQNKEIDFNAGKLPWGVWHLLHKVIVHKGDYYLRTQSTPGQRRMQPARILNYRNAQGEFLSYDEIKDLLPEQKESIKQQMAGLNKTIWVRTYKFDSIQKIRIAGQTYKLIK